MRGSVIWTDQRDPNGRAIHYNVDKSSRELAQEFHAARLDDEMLEVPNEDGSDDPIFVNPDHVASVVPEKEED